MKKLIEFAFHVLTEQLSNGESGDQEYIAQAIEAISDAGSVDDVIRLQTLLNERA